MKEDILEQLADDYLKSRGYFTQHNIKFKPIEGDPGYNKKSDAVCSDIDILAINTTLNNKKRVIEFYPTLSELVVSGHLIYRPIFTQDRYNNFYREFLNYS